MYYLNVISEKGKYNQTPASRKLVGLVPKRKSKKKCRVYKPKLPLGWHHIHYM